MKLKSAILVLLTGLCFTNSNAQLSFVEDAMRFAVLVPDSGVNCSPKTKPCAILNKSADRAIKVKIEKSVRYNNELSSTILVFDNISPNEKRYVGCAGNITEGQNIKGVGYKILLSSFEEADSVKVRNLLNDNVHDNDTVTFRHDGE